MKHEHSTLILTLYTLKFSKVPRADSTADFTAHSTPILLLIVLLRMGVECALEWECFLWSSVVRGGSVWLNHPELMSSSTPGLVPCVVLWFEQVWKS